MTKKRIPKMNPTQSMYELFTGEKEGKVADNKDSFADLLANETLDFPSEKDEKLTKSSKNIGEVLKSYPRPQKTVDLHGMRQEQAQQQIEWFIQNAYHNGLMTLKIIAGKGGHSRGGEAVLPDVTETVLRSFKQEDIVLAFRWEKGSKKSGVVIVYLTGVLPSDF